MAAEWAKEPAEWTGVRPEAGHLAASHGVDENMLLFYCRQCETSFESEPDGTGYEQAPCPRCGDICLTAQFEHEEQERHRNEAAVFRFFMSFLGSVLSFFRSLSMIGSFIGLFSILRNNGLEVDPKGGQAGGDGTSAMQCPVTLSTFDNPGEADMCRTMLDRFGIETRLVYTEGTNPFMPGAGDAVVVQVSSGDEMRARQIIAQYHSLKKERREARLQSEPIGFACEECGKEITFPAHRGGCVEICPHCGRYVDVPEKR